MASKGISDRIYIKLDLDVDYNSMRRFADSMKNTEGTGLYILINNATGEISSFANQQGLVLWDQSELEQQIGKAILANASGEPMELKLTRPSTETPFNLFEPPVAQEKQEKGIFGLFSDPSPPQSDPESRSTFKWPEFGPPSSDKDRVRDQPTSSRPYYEDREENVLRIPLPSLPINMGKTSAIKVGQAKVGEVQDFLLKFIPYYSYRYNFAIKKKFGSEVVDLNGQGEGMVNAITGENKFSRFPGVLEYVEIPTENYQIKEPVIVDNNAQDTALDAIISKHTQNMKKDQVKGDAIVYASKTLSPDKSDINLPIQLVYVPVWEISGKRNTIDINAYDGHVLEEPVDDDAEFV
ncbi:MAG: hypothetical protein M8349_05405 [ANME-2 cluster archaeon]|nr:hypothetical protein [ANME-2 cluster archaeon]